MSIFIDKQRVLTDNDVLITHNFFVGSHKNWTKLPVTASDSTIWIFNFNVFFITTREMSDYVVSVLIDNSHGNAKIRLRCWTPKQSFLYSNWIEPGQCGFLTLTLPADLFSKKENYNTSNICLETNLNQGDTNALFKHEMLESGSIPSNWSPAPQDLGLAMKADLDSLKAEIEQLKQK